MDSVKIWIYLVIGIIYIISRVIKSSNKPSRKEASPSKPYGGVPSTGKTERPKTFEELLQEITESKTQQAPQKPQNKPQTISRPASESKGQIRDVRKEKRPLEDVNYDYRKHDNVYEVYENAKKQAFLKPSLEETMKVRDTDVSFGKFKEFDQSYKPTLLDQYISELKNPEGYKKAFVLSEVLNRKF